MKLRPLPPPLVPPEVDGRLLGPPPRSLFIRLAMETFGVSEAEAALRVDQTVRELGMVLLDDRDTAGPLTRGTA